MTCLYHYRNKENDELFKTVIDGDYKKRNEMIKSRLPLNYNTILAGFIDSNKSVISGIAVSGSQGICSGESIRRIMLDKYDTPSNNYKLFSNYANYNGYQHYKLIKISPCKCFKETYHQEYGVHKFSCDNLCICAASLFGRFTRYMKYKYVSKDYIDKCYYPPLYIQSFTELRSALYKCNRKLLLNSQGTIRKRVKELILKHIRDKESIESLLYEMAISKSDNKTNIFVMLIEYISEITLMYNTDYINKLYSLYIYLSETYKSPFKNFEFKFYADHPVKFMGEYGYRYHKYQADSNYFYTEAFFRAMETGNKFIFDNCREYVHDSITKKDIDLYLKLIGNDYLSESS